MNTPERLNYTLKNDYNGKFYIMCILQAKDKKNLKALKQ